MYMDLIPPTHQTTLPLQQICPSAHLVYYYSLNVLLNGDAATPGVILHVPQSLRLQGLLHRKPLPSLRPDAPCLLLRDTPIDEVTERFHYLHHGFHDDPDLAIINKDHLKD